MRATWWRWNMPRKNIEGLKLPENWRSETERYIRRHHKYYCLGPPDSPDGRAHLKEAIRILYHEETEGAFRYLLDAAIRTEFPLGPVSFAQYIAICAINPPPIGRHLDRMAKKLESMKHAWDEIVHFLNPENLEKLEGRILLYRSIVGSRKSGRRAARSREAIAS